MNTPTESDKANSQMLFQRITSSHSSLGDVVDKELVPKKKKTISKVAFHVNHANGLLQVYRVFQNLKRNYNNRNLNQSPTGTGFLGQILIQTLGNKKSSHFNIPSHILLVTRHFQQR